MARDPNRRPTHPGEILREDVLPALGLTQAQFAQELGVSRLSVSELLNEKRALSPEMAVRLERTLGETAAEIWLAMQREVDLWEARKALEEAEGPAVAEAASLDGDFWIEVAEALEVSREHVTIDLSSFSAETVEQLMPYSGGEVQVHEVIERARASSQVALTAPKGASNAGRATT